MTAVAGLGLALVLASRLAVQSETSDFLPRGAGAALAPLTGILPVDPLIVVIEQPTPMLPAEVGPLLDSLAASLARLPEVRRVEHRLAGSVRGFLAERMPGFLLHFFSEAEIDTLAERLGPDYMERALLGRGEPIARNRLAVAMRIERTDPLGVIDPALRRLRELGGGVRVKVVDGYFAVPDQHAFFMLVEPRTTLHRIDDARRVVAAVDRVLDEVRARQQPWPPGREVHAVGRTAAVVAGSALAVGDLGRVAAATAVVVFLLLALATRRIAAPLLIVGTVLAGVTVTAAVASLLVGGLNVISWLFIAALLGFGDEFALYLVVHYWMTAPRGTPRDAALAGAIRHPGPGIVLGGLTTAGAFLSLGVMPYPVMTELAWFSTLGILMILAATFTLLPLALAWTVPGRDLRPADARVLPVPVRQGRAWPTLLAWGVVMAASLLAASRVRIDLHPWRLAVRGVPESARLADLSARLGASVTPFLLVSRGATEDEALARERESVRALDGVRDDAGIAALVAASRWIPSDSAWAETRAALRRHGEVLSPKRFARDFRRVAIRGSVTDTMLTRRYPETIAAYLAFDTLPITVDRLRREGLAPVLDRHLVAIGDSVAAIALVYPTEVPWAPGVVERFQSVVAATPGLARAEFVGDALRNASQPARLRRDFALATLAAVVITVLILLLRFRRPLPVLLALLPAGCGMAASFGVMGVLGLEVNLLSLVLVPVILGLGSDDGIHVMDRLSRGDPVPQILRETGRPMIITTLTTVAGLACLGVARFPMVGVMGLVAGFGLLVSLAASMHLLPALHGSLERR